ncbi:MAG: hypothetical protein F6J95_016235 [Leptolyngbya sp. SIO1E4]|nr:hypothetical protein [Leptolyngbya sp. SIO1E4]
MKEQLQQRLQELKSEYASGQKVLADLEAKQANIQSTLLRIQGAIQVLEEELAKTEVEEIPATSSHNLTRDPVEVLTNSHG